MGIFAEDWREGGLQVKYKVGGPLIFALALGLFGLGQQRIAVAQAGSVGGVIGKTDKSVSGGEGAPDSRQARPTRKPPRSGKQSEAAVSTGGPCNRIIGTWLWYNGVSVTVHANSDRTTQSDGNSAKLVCADGVYAFTWHGFATAQMTLSPSGKRLSGTAPIIGAISAVRQ